MTHSADHFQMWLRDAHALELHAATLLRSQTGRLENYPDLRDRLDQHLLETQAQAETLQRLLDRQQAGGSLLKSVAGRISATAQGISGLLSGDEVVRTAMAAYTFEHSEIATYRVLIAAADELGDGEAVDACEKILQEEIEMAGWLDRYLDPLTRLYLMRDERNLQAKR